MDDDKEPSVWSRAESPDRFVTRRSFLAGTAAVMALAACRPDRAIRVVATTRTDEPFPANIALYRQGFVNWSQDIVVDDVPTCAPRTAVEVLAVANWAARNRQRLRARGAMHTWSPLVIGEGSDTRNVVLVDTHNLSDVSVRRNGAGAVVTAQTGATLEAVMTALEQEGFGFVASPAPGDVTIGGVLAIDGHGTAIPARGEHRAPGATYGTLSNLIVSLTAVVWDDGASQFRLQKFRRDDPRILPFLTHLGRTFVTEVTLQATRNQRLRCVSTVDVPWREMFARPGTSSKRTFAHFLDASGRAEAIWFPGTDNPWLKVWSVAPTRPPSAREVDGPYNYPFAEIDAPQAASIRAGVVADPAQALSLGELAYERVASGLSASGSDDIWGWSKDLLLYVRPNTLRYSANGYAVMTARANVQRILHDFTHYYSSVVARFAVKGRYPASGPVEIRVTGVDKAMPELPGRGEPPLLSAARPRPDRPEWDVVIWLDILSFADTPFAGALYRDIEQWLLGSQRRWSALVRPEWSKGWGYTESGPWRDSDFFERVIPTAFRTGYRSNNDWDGAARALHAADPRQVFHDRLLDRLMPPRDRRS